MTGLDWKRFAACRGLGLDTDAWGLPDGAGRKWDHDGLNKAAIRICRNCPVRVACARYALAPPWPVGVILAGVPVRGDSQGGRSAYSVAALERIARAA